MNFDFFLTAAGETRELLVSPRACRSIGRLKDSKSDQHMLVEIEPVLPGQPFGLASGQIRTLVLSPKFTGTTLYPISEWPFHVYVARILGSPISDGMKFTKDQVEIIAWGRLFKTFKDAEAAAVSAESQ